MTGVGESSVDTKTFTCRECGQHFIGQVLSFGGREMLTTRACEDCVAQHEAARALDGAAADREALDASWRSICPPLYRDTDKTRLPEKLITAAREFDGTKSLGMIGAAGAGKTRAAFLALRAQHFRGKACAYINGSTFNRHVANKGADFPEIRDEAYQALRTIRHCDILLLDDVGKQKFTDASEQELYDLLEHRTSHLKPIIWTANSNAKEMGKRISTDRADAILRRLTEFSTIVKA